MAEAKGRVIAVANMKGGVGKTTTVVMLAEGFAAQGKRVVVIDLDAQANASYCFASDDELKLIYDKRRSITSFFADRIVYSDAKPISKYLNKDVSKVTKAGERLPIDLIAAHPRLRLLEREAVLILAEKNYTGPKSLEGRSLKVLEEALAALRASHDVVLFDCAPGISAFTEVAIRLSDMVLVPMIPDFLSTLGFDAFRASIWEDAILVKSALPKPAKSPFLLPTRVNATKRQHRETLEGLEAEAAVPGPVYTLFDIRIHNQAPIERAMDPELFDGAPTFEQKWEQSVGLVRGLADETWRRLNG